MSDEIVIVVKKDCITINGLKCTKHNFQEVFHQVGIGEYEAKQVIKLISAKIYKRRGVLKRE